MKEVGPLDERFSIGMFEDDNYSHRVRLGDYRVIFAEDAFVHRFRQTSFGKMSREQYCVAWDRSRTFYEEKWETRWNEPDGR